MCKTADALILTNVSHDLASLEMAGRQSAEQRAFQAAWEQAGGWYILATSLDDVIREMGE